MSELCPDCGRPPFAHLEGCLMFGMTTERSSLLYGYPVCQCCGLRAGEERLRRHIIIGELAGSPLAPARGEALR